MKLLVLVFLCTYVYTAYGAEIIVNSTGGGLGTSQLCSLRAAIRAAESDQPFSACPAGSGDDIIILPENATIKFFEVDSSGGGTNALPRVRSTIIIEGNNATLLRKENAPMMRFIKTVHHYPSGDTGHLTMRNLTLKNGFVDGSGGAIENVADLVLDNVRIIDNKASFEGGGLSCSGSIANCIVKNSAFINNSASYAGAIKNFYAHLELSNTFIHNNEATIGINTADGGSIFNEHGDFIITNSTISHNNAFTYGGIFHEGSGLAIINYSTIVGNNPIGLIGDIEIKNSILSDNINGNCRNYSNVISNGFNHSNDSTCPFNQSGDINNITAYLRPLTTHSTNILTFPLQYNSPAIDSADQSDCLNTDQRGVDRPLDGNNDGIYLCDKGAHEMINRIIFENGFEIISTQ